MAQVFQELERTHYWSTRWEPAIYFALAEAGFISTAVAYAGPAFLLLP